MTRQTKWVVAALALSIAINIFMVGLSIGKNVIGGRFERPPGQAPGINARALGQYLSADERRVMRALLDSARPEIGRKSAILRQNEEAIRKALRAEEVDIENLRALIDQHEALVMDTRTSVQRKLFEFMATLAPETRRAFADELFKAPPRRERGGDREGMRRPPPGERDDFAPPPRRREPS